MECNQRGAPRCKERIGSSADRLVQFTGEGHSNRVGASIPASFTGSRSESHSQGYLAAIKMTAALPHLKRSLARRVASFEMIPRKIPLGTLLNEATRTLIQIAAL